MDHGAHIPKVLSKTSLPFQFNAFPQPRGLTQKKKKSSQREYHLCLNAHLGVYACMHGRMFVCACSKVNAGFYLRPSTIGYWVLYGALLGSVGGGVSMVIRR